MINFGKASYLHSGETKIKAELAIVDRKIKGHKQNFGLALFETLSEAEDARGYLPSDRQVRNIYDTCRGDIQAMEANKKKKIEELSALGWTVSDEKPAEDVSMQPNGTSGYSAPDQPRGYSDANPSMTNNGPEDLLL